MANFLRVYFKKFQIFLSLGILNKIYKFKMSIIIFIFDVKEMLHIIFIEDFLMNFVERY